MQMSSRSLLRTVIVIAGTLLIIGVLLSMSITNTLQ
jgi:hypothetical protein